MKAGLDLQVEGIAVVRVVSLLLHPPGPVEVVDEAAPAHEVHVG